jgi:21S rRNA (GM2251-2'-O)-methyltransferase
MKVTLRAHSSLVTMATMWIFSVRKILAWAPPRSQRRFVHRSLPVLRLEIDDQGRRVRRRPQEESNSWDNFYPNVNNESSPESTPPRAVNIGGWDDFVPPFRTKRPSASMLSDYRSESSGRGSDRRERGSDRRERGSDRRSRSSDRLTEMLPADRKINLNALEGAGFVHLYGLSSVLNALEANKRDFTRPEDEVDMKSLEDEAFEREQMQRERKPEAQFSPWLFVQTQMGRVGRSSDKAAQAVKVEELAKERGIPIAPVDKGVLNSLSGNRPHQGYVLRCGKLVFEDVTIIPHPDQDLTAPKFWLVLDEVVDPQNLGALLRSAYFLSGLHIGILVCAKNSAPPSPTVSAASAGALELVTVCSTSNLPRTLAKAESDGFRIVGASASVPRDLDAPLYELQDLPNLDGPTLLVLGSEGHGLRTLVAKSCTEFVKVPGSIDAPGVDSLNVSVTGGILLWHFMKQARNVS